MPEITNYYPAIPVENLHVSEGYRVGISRFLLAGVGAQAGEEISSR